jgi:ribosome biogenesis GTPase
LPHPDWLVARPGEEPERPLDRAAALALLGFDPERAAGPAAGAAEPARVARVDRGRATVLTATGSLRAGFAAAAPAPAVGDFVLIEPGRDGSAVVAAVLDRRTAFVRHGRGLATAAQVLAANVDVAAICHALDAPPNLRRIERYLALGHESGAQPVVLLTKADRCRDVPAAVADVRAVAAGAPVLPVSAVDGTGLDAVRGLLGAGRTLALLGLSGAGKSTLANALAEVEAVRTGATNRLGLGRHTTTHRELVVLEDGILLDTPGLRTLQLWDAADGIDRAYVEIADLARDCRFADCAHAGEPGCAVQAAVASGELHPDRLAAYDRLQREQRALAVRQDARAASEQRRAVRVRARAYRARRPKGG